MLTLVAYDVSHQDIVGLCDAGPSRRDPGMGEVYRMYLEHHARRHGLGREMFEQVTAWLRRKKLDEGAFLVRQAEILRVLVIAMDDELDDAVADLVR